MNPRTVHQFPLKSGSHPTPEHGMCAMEMVAWLAGEPHSDEPACACPVIGSVVRCFNDALPTDLDRERLLRPLVPLLLNTKSTRAVESARASLVADCVARVIAPIMLQRQYRRTEADALLGMAPVRNRDGARHALQYLPMHELKVARWVLQRAADSELPPTLWVSGVVWAAREVGAPGGWYILGELLRAMAQVGRVAMPSPEVRVEG